MRSVSLCLIFVTSLVSLAAAQETADPGGAGALADRDVPPPPVPGIETLPPGTELKSWRTWSQGQEIDGLTRITISLGLAGGQPMPMAAGNGENAPNWDDIADFSPGMNLEVEYALAPAIGVGVNMRMFVMSGNWYDIRDENGQWLGGLDVEENPVLAGGLVLRLRLPLAMPLSEAFRFSRAETPTGVNLYAKFGAGLGYFTQWNAFYDAADNNQDMEIAYFSRTVTLQTSFTLGIEYRWVNFGLFLELSVVNFGTPNPSLEEDWKKASEAGPLVTSGFQLGLSVSF